MMPSNHEVYAEITDRILKALEGGVVPWERPWQGGAGPSNLVSRKPYRGMNVLILAMSGRQSPYWLTYRQAQALGGHVRQGERGTRIHFWKPLRVRGKDEGGADGGGADVEAGGKARQVLMAKTYTVFNVEQCEDIAAPEVPGDLVFEPIAEAERILTGIRPVPRVETGTAAYFHAREDYVAIPPKASFVSVEHYYSTLFHELTHWTGHKDRLARETLAQATRFGDSNYSKEELVAEMGSGFLGAMAGIDTAPVEKNRVAYLQNWLAALKNDKRLVISAAAQAQRAVDYLLAGGGPVETGVVAVAAETEKVVA